MSCIAVSVSNRSASGATSRKARPSGPLTARTPWSVNSRYFVWSAPRGSRSSYSKSGTVTPSENTVLNAAAAQAVLACGFAQRKTCVVVACATPKGVDLCARWLNFEGSGRAHTKDPGGGGRCSPDLHPGDRLPGRLLEQRHRVGADPDLVHQPRRRRR